MINISRADSNLVISRLVNYGYGDIKKLPQADRKICLKAIERFSSAQDTRLAINLPKGMTFEQKVENIQIILQSKINPKKITLVKLIAKVFKGILNILHLRVGSENLYQRMKAIRDKFLTQNWNQYLKDNFEEIGSNCNRDEANIFFLGDIHSDHIQKKIKKNLIRHYAQENNILLLECSRKPVQIKKGNKNFTIESWENEEHYKRHGDKVNEFLQLARQFKTMRKNTPVNVATQEKYKQIILQIRENAQKCNELKKLRDQDLIQKVKDSALKPNQKIFVIAGRRHFKDDENGYKILNLFHEYKCTMMLPKKSKKAKEDWEKIREKMLDTGTLTYRL